MPNELAVRRFGSGDPLVLLHGGSGRAELWDGFIAHLPAGWEAVAIDLPGHGRSPWTPGRYDLDSVAGAVGEFVATLDIEPVVFGHSYGGHVALVLAARQPAATRGLIVGDVPLSGARFSTLLEGGRARMRRWRGLSGGALSEAQILGALAETPMGGATAGEVLGADHPRLVSLAACLHAHDPSFLDAFLDEPGRMLAALRPAELLPRIRVPVLFVGGDPAVGGLWSAEDTADAHEFVGDVTVEIIEGVGHSLQDDDPTAVAAVVVPFLERLANA